MYPYAEREREREEENGYGLALRILTQQLQGYASQSRETSSTRVLFLIAAMRSKFIHAKRT